AGPSARPVLRNVMDKRLSAVDAFVKADYGGSVKALDEAAALLAGVAPVHAGQLAEVWKLERDLASGQARYESLTWTRPMLTMSEQLSLVLMLELAFGVIFELPLVMALLGVVGLLKASWLMRYQRHAFVVCILAAALLTPTGDAVNLALMALPMLLCFELGVVAVWLIEKRRAKADTETAITPVP
ncbi:MAG TPA: twin-arginine translocase subunit TatC, partial [Myxococcaceae bacterium]|nr:twin-arginine translocase subunit TatC [Myxococcaceae bacterium]